MDGALVQSRFRQHIKLRQLDYFVQHGSCTVRRYVQTDTECVDTHALGVDQTG